MKLILSYLKFRRGQLIMLPLCCAVFCIVFYLYRLPVDAVGYAAAISLFFLIIAAVPDYLHFIRKHRQLQALKTNALLLCGQNPQENTLSADSLPEADYQELLYELAAEARRLSDREQLHYAELNEYYTLWAHQIKTPIAAMNLMLQDEDGLSRQELKEQLLRIEQYVEMVLCYLRLDSESTDYIIQEYSLDSIIKQAVRHYASQFIRKKIRLEYTPILYPVITDEKWLLFVIEQLFSNALKYTPSGTISVTMEEPGLLVIRDTGIGIAPEDLPRIFEKGYTGCNGRTDKKASGIGLYLCRRICRNLKHELTVTSCPGQGTAVTLDLRRNSLTVE